MKFTKEKIEEINAALDKDSYNYLGYVSELNIRVSNSYDNVDVIIKKNALLTIDELGKAIEELTMLKEFIEEIVGIVIE